MVKTIESADCTASMLSSAAYPTWSTKLFGKPS